MVRIFVCYIDFSVYNSYDDGDDDMIILMISTMCFIKNMSLLLGQKLGQGLSDYNNFV